MYFLLKMDIFRGYYVSFLVDVSSKTTVDGLDIKATGEGW